MRDDDQAAQARIDDLDRLEAVRTSGFRPNTATTQVERIVQLAREATGASTALLSIVDDHRQFFPAHAGLDDPWAASGETPLSHSVCRDVVANRCELVIDDLAADPRYERHPARGDLAVESYCGVPVRDEDGQVLGSLCAIDNEAHAWDDGDVQRLRDLSDLLTDVVALYRNHEILVRDLKQQLRPVDGVSPHRGRIETTSRPATDGSRIGGDFVDVLARPDGSVDVVLGDAVGHGVISTQAAAQLRAAVAILLRTTDGGVDEVMGRLSDSVDVLRGCDLASLMLLRIAPDGASATWMRAGCMPPVAITADGGRILDGGTRPLLGLPSDTTAPGTISLRTGESLLLYSDGIVDRRDAAIDERIDALVVAARRSVTVDEIVGRMLAGNDEHDDITLLRWTRD